MVPPLTVLEEALFSTGTLGLGVVSLIPSVAALCSKRARSHLRAGITMGLVMSGWWCCHWLLTSSIPTTS